MAQSTQMISALKYCLKQKGLTYADVAKHLNLSEASVKRIFSEANISLARLESICHLMQMEISDLSKLTLEQQNQLQELTEQQEAEFVQKPKLLFVAYMLLNDMDFETIKRNYQIDEHEGIQLLAHLDRIKFIDLLPGNRVKLLTSRNFRWRKNGAIEKLFNEQIRKEFFQTNFSKADDKIQFSGAIVSRATLLKMHDKIAKLMTEFNALALQDVNVPFEEKMGCGLVSAIRPFEFSLFSQYRRDA